jgi:PEP-CTERM motif
MKKLAHSVSFFRASVFVAAILALMPTANGQFVMMPDSTNNRLVLFDPVNGSLVNSNAFGLAGGTPIHALQVGTEIWVSEQVGDRVSRWSFSGASLGAVTGGLDNIRGMALVGNTLYVTNAGTGNGAPGAAVVRFDLNGNNLGFFGTAGLAPSPFDVFLHQGDLLVSSSAANNDIHRFTLGGTSVGSFHNSATLNFAEQMDYRTNGNILVAGFSPPSAVYELDANTGAILNSWAAGLGQRGVYQLGNGNILWTNGSGAFVLDPNTAISTQVYTGGGRYLDFVDFAIPEPASFWLIGAASVATLVRRRRR